MPRWTRRPEGSTWGDFGPDDTLGRLNLIGPQQVLRGVAEVQEGRVFSLSLPLTLPGLTVLNPNRFPPIVRPTTRAVASATVCAMTSKPEMPVTEHRYVRCTVVETRRQGATSTPRLAR